jgi:hypothetical protein
MDTQFHHAWKRIGSRPSDLWSAGILAVVNQNTDKVHFVATRNVGKRVRDQHHWLTRQIHHNHELQRDWDRSQEDFEFYLVRRVFKPSMLNHEKQILIDEFSKAGQCYNRKRAEPILKARPKPSSIEGMLLEIARLAASL